MSPRHDSGEHEAVSAPETLPAPAPAAPERAPLEPCPFALPVKIRESEHLIPEGPIERWVRRWQVISPYPNGYSFVLAEFSSRATADWIAAAINAYAPEPVGAAPQGGSREARYTLDEVADLIEERIEYWRDRQRKAPYGWIGVVEFLRRRATEGGPQ